MKFSVLFSGLASVALFAGCVNPAKSYASKHPELTPAQRLIFTRGSIPSGDAVAGLSREQVKIAMGGDPVTYDKINGEDVWVYAHKKMVGNPSFDGGERPGNSRMETDHSFSRTEDLGPRTDVDVKTSIFFQGDRATHALESEERP